jgi:undecaprenyl-diphosphatase
MSYNTGLEARCLFEPDKNVITDILYSIFGPVEITQEQGKAAFLSAFGIVILTRIISRMSQYIGRIWMAVYVFFELHVVNYRPVLIEGVLEASYPSSTTMLVMCVMPTAMMQFRARIKNHTLRRCFDCLITAFIVFMITLRLISGVHWVTDVIGGVLLSAGLTMMYASISNFERTK